MKFTAAQAPLPAMPGLIFVSYKTQCPIPIAISSSPQSTGRRRACQPALRCVHIRRHLHRYRDTDRGRPATPAKRRHDPALLVRRGSRGCVVFFCVHKSPEHDSTPAFPMPCTISPAGSILPRPRPCGHPPAPDLPTARSASGKCHQIQVCPHAQHSATLQRSSGLSSVIRYRAGYFMARALMF